MSDQSREQKIKLCAQTAERMEQLLKNSFKGEEINQVFEYSMNTLIFLCASFIDAIIDDNNFGQKLDLSEKLLKGIQQTLYLKEEYFKSSQTEH